MYFTWGPSICLFYICCNWFSSLIVCLFIHRINGDVHTWCFHPIGNSTFNPCLVPWFWRGEIMENIGSQEDGPCTLRFFAVSKRAAALHLHSTFSGSYVWLLFWHSVLHIKNKHWTRSHFLSSPSSFSRHKNTDQHSRHMSFFMGTRHCHSRSFMKISVIRTEHVRTYRNSSFSMYFTGFTHKKSMKKEHRIAPVQSSWDPCWALPRVTSGRTLQLSSSQKCQ